MKGFINTVATSLIALALCSSCEKFLTEEPQTSLPPSGVFNTERGLESATVGLYYRFSSTSITHSFMWYLSYVSKTHIWKSTQPTTQYEQFHNMTLYSYSNEVNEFFQTRYAAINECNSLLEELNGSSVDEAYKKEIEGEARFIRAYIYLDLMRLWGDVPLIKKSPSDISETFVKRDPYQNVFEFIIEEFFFAETAMRTKARQDAVNPDGGRCYREAATAAKMAAYIWMASMMQNTTDQFFDTAKEGRSPLNHPTLVYMGLKEASDAWRAALECGEKLISGPDSPYALEPDFRNLFRWDPDKHPEDYWSKERIIVLQNSTQADFTCEFVKGTLWKHPYGTLSKTGSHTTAGKNRPAAWVWQKWNEMHGNTKFCNNNREIRQASTDPRLPATYQYTSFDSWDESNYGTKKTVKGIFPNAKNMTTATTGAGAYHFFRKHLSPLFNTDGGAADNYILRMADIYLWAAEACAFLGEEAKAVDYVNVVLKRARESVDNPSTPAAQPADWTVAQFDSQQKLVDAIMMEHLFERHGENQEWFDLHRHGAQWLIDNVAVPYNTTVSLKCMATVKASMCDVYGYLTPTDPEMVRKVMILPYPLHELNTNTALTEKDQNDFFYE